MFGKLKPLLPQPADSAGGDNSGRADSVIPGEIPGNEKQMKEDFKKSVRIEKYRIGEKAVYIPAGFSWKYLLIKDIREVKRGKWLIRSDNSVAPWAEEAPALRLLHLGGEEILELEKERNAERALSLLL